MTPRVIDRAVEALRSQYGDALDPYGLAGDQFTVLELRSVYEAVFAHRMQKDSFRRHVIRHLVDTGRTSLDAIGRPAAVFTRRVDSALPPATRSFFESAAQ